MFSSPTGDSHPIYNAPMMGAHQAGQPTPGHRLFAFTSPARSGCLWRYMSKSRLAMLAAFLCFAACCPAQEPMELRETREAYQKGPKTETARANYVERLVLLRQQFASARNQAWQVVDAEIRHHPAPPDSSRFARIMIGKWRSPRHDYVYRRNGTWSMLPAEPDSTRGKWHFVGNVCIETNILGTYRYTTILLTAEDYVCTDGEVVFYRKRLSK